MDISIHSRDAVGFIIGTSAGLCRRPSRHALQLAVKYYKRTRVLVSSDQKCHPNTAILTASGMMELATVCLFFACAKLDPKSLTPLGDSVRALDLCESTLQLAFVYATRMLKAAHSGSAPRI